MAYIGKQPLVGNYISCDALSASATTTYNLTSNGTAVYPTVPQNCLVSLNGVVQAPVTSYTISGATIVFSTVLSTTDTIDYVTVLGSTLNIGTPSNDTVGLDQLSATGTPSATTFLRGDNAWATPAADIAWQSVQTTSFTAVAARAYPVNTTSAGITVTLPASPAAGDQIILVDYAGTWDTNPLTINPNSNKIVGQTSNVTASKDREGLSLVYIDSTQGWIPYSGYQESTSGVAIPYSIDFLVIAGGGGSGGNNADEGSTGGGGAGGYRTSTQSISPGTLITVTVGDGGAGGVAADGSNGSNSSISGPGVTTITSAGGGGGASIFTAGGKNGGSGGGGGYGQAPGGAGNTPSTSPSQGNNGGNAASPAPPSFSGGGGGGAGAVGGTGVSPGAGGNGGNGTASSITGSSVTRAGGGGGGSYTNASSGGTGGGGAGGAAASGTAGTANTGGGAGGTSTQSVARNGSAGGKGVVILSVPTANYSGTTTGSPTVTTSGSNTIMQFNGNGSYTA